MYNKLSGATNKTKYVKITLILILLARGLKIILTFL